MLSRNFKIALISAIILLPALFVFLFYALYFGQGLFTFWHQSFAANGVAQIKPASQMDAMYADCRHFITYGPNNVSIWNSVAYFDGRYELTMQVPVQISSSTSGRMTGQPQFHLREVSAVSVDPDGQVGAKFSREFVFGLAQWKNVVDAGGDFGAIGFKMNTGAPVKDFEAHAKGAR